MRLFCATIISIILVAQVSADEARTIQPPPNWWDHVSGKGQQEILLDQLPALLEAQKQGTLSEKVTFSIHQAPEAGKNATASAVGNVGTVVCDIHTGAPYVNLPTGRPTAELWGRCDYVHLNPNVLPPPFMTWVLGATLLQGEFPPFATAGTTLHPKSGPFLWSPQWGLSYVVAQECNSDAYLHFNFLNIFVPPPYYANTPIFVGTPAVSHLDCS